MSATPKVTFVIMAGGKGERLWPLARRNRPKVCLSPEGRHSLLETTIARLRAAWPQADWLIVTTAGQAGPIRRVLPPSLRSRVLVEPAIRSTAACITLAAVAVARRDPGRILVIAPADHWVDRPAALQRAVRAGIQAAAREATIATIGIKPTHAHTGLGYLCAGAKAGRQVFRLARFVEKPSAAQARRLLKRPRTFWNSGIFIASAGTILAQVRQWLPEHARRLEALGPAATLDALSRRAAGAYRRLPVISFDHGVMDHVRDGLVVEAGFRWADLGSWDTWAALGAPQSRVVAVDSPRVTVVGSARHLVATLGVRDLVVVHTPTATLICNRARTQSVRDIVKLLDQRPQFAAFR